jgi:hypothetical protein
VCNVGCACLLLLLLLLLLLFQVVFSYNPLIGQPVLKGVSFTAPGGKTLAIVGSTGSGKSSLLRCEEDLDLKRSRLADVGCAKLNISRHTMLMVCTLIAFARHYWHCQGVIAHARAWSVAVSSKCRDGAALATPRIA